VSGKALNRIRAVCAAIATAALLLYVNTAQMDTDSEDALHSVGTVHASVDYVLAQRRAQAYSDAWIEYASLVIFVLGGTTALAAPRVLGIWARGQQPA
jgi:hypothetical protein